MKHLLLAGAALSFLLGLGNELALAQGTAPAATEVAKVHSALKPEPRPDDWWKQRHEQILANAKGGADLVFIGDSITQGWETEGKEAWEKHYGARHAVNA